MTSIDIAKKSIMLLIFVVCASGCYSSNERQGAARKRALKKDMRLLQKDVDSFLGTNEPSMLSE
ncbi:MAG: hypothetical protein ACC651_01250 [Candidatus Scalindua sp.]